MRGAVRVEINATRMLGWVSVYEAQTAPFMYRHAGYGVRAR